MKEIKNYKMGEELLRNLVKAEENAAKEGWIDEEDVLAELGE